MIVQKEFLVKLKDDFRLNIYEVKIWTALLSRGIATAGELADISGVPRSRCYDVLESLEKKGFIIMKIGKPIKYIAVQPEEIVARVKKNLKTDSEQAIDMFDKLRDTVVFKELDLLYKSGIEHIDPTEISKSIVGRSNVNHTIKNMINKAKSDVIISTSQNGFMKDMGPLKAVMKSLNARNITTKVIAPVEEKLAKKYNVKNLKNLELNSRFVLADDELLFMISNEGVTSDGVTAVWIKSDFFTTGIGTLIHKL